MKNWKKSKIVKIVLFGILIASVFADVLAGMYMIIGREYAWTKEDSQQEFFISQEETNQLLDGYIRLFEEYMQIGKIITEDGDIDYDKKILVSLDKKHSYTIKSLLKNSDTEGEASGKLRDFMDDFANNCKEQKSYPWITGFMLNSYNRVIVDKKQIYTYASNTTKGYSKGQIANMYKHQKSMIPLTTTSNKYRDGLEKSIRIKLYDKERTRLRFIPKSTYEEYLCTYYSRYAKAYFLKEAITSYTQGDGTDFSKMYEKYKKKISDETVTQKDFLRILKKSYRRYDKEISRGETPWRAHIIPRTMEEARGYVTFLVETYQELKYLFARTNFVFAYENSSNLLITNNRTAWANIKEDDNYRENEQKGKDSDKIVYAYYNSKRYHSGNTLKEDSLSMSGNIIEKLQNIGRQTDTASYEIGVGIDLEGVRNGVYDDEFTRQYETSKDKITMFKNGRDAFAISSVLSILSFVLLGILCGYDRNTGTIQLKWYDRIWGEIQIFLTVIFLRMSLWMLQLWNGTWIWELLLFYSVGIALLVLGGLAVLLSMIKKQKVRSQLRYSLLGTLIKEVFFQKMNRQQWVALQRKKIAQIPVEQKRKYLLLFQGMVLGYWMLCGVFVKVDREVTCSDFLWSGMGFVAEGLFVLLVVVILLWEKKVFQSQEVTNKIGEGIQKILEGDLQYQLPQDIPMGYWEEKMVENINQIGEVLEKAVEESVRSERLKTELIANVSHDIKTPLTSVINYVDLIKRENIQDETIKKYVTILERKSLRLKTLIEDLVEASKASSGVMDLEISLLNFNELIMQTNGEFEDRFEECHLELVATLPKESMKFMGDGRRVFRILENLYNNTAKYAMAYTRVYVTLEKVEDSIVFSMKNISASKLNITPEELTERFVRGDRSRTTEGSGLGLSIAKSLTELMGGEFRIELDGDLFCARVSFPENKDSDLTQE